MSVTNDSISEISSTTAKANATIIDIGHGITQHGHCWSTDAEPTINANENMTDNGHTNNTGPFSSVLTSLTPGTKYYVRAYVKNEETVVYGGDILSFKTLSLGTPDVTTGTVTNISTSSATVNANLSSFGAGASSVTQHGHCWSNETLTPVIEDNENKTSLGSRDTTGNYKSQLVGLFKNTLYYVRAYATNGAGTAYGDIISFITDAELPIISTSGITSVTDTSGQGGGDITDDGGATVTARGVCWSTSENPTILDPHSNEGSGAGSFISNIIGLLYDTKYYVRAYATNRAGTAYGNLIFFTTGQEITSPVVTTTIISSITEISAQSGGYVASEGGTTVTACGVCWSTSENPELSDIHTTDGSGTGLFVSNITGLSPGTTYYVKAYATNSAGTAYGNELFFTTKIIDWQKSLGGSGSDNANSIQLTTDGGYIIAGSSSSNDGDVSENHGASDYWIVKLTATGELDWEKSFGGSGFDESHSVQQTTDGGYIIAGGSNSDDGDVTENHGNYDFWVVKLTSTGNLDWQKSLGGSNYEGALSIQQTTDEGYIIAGGSYSNDHDVSGNHGSYDYWIVKLTSTGALGWQKSFGGSDYEGALSIKQTTDEGYIIAGESASNDVDVSGNHGNFDYWVVKLTSTGNLDWQKSLGGSKYDKAYAIQQTIDGGYIIAGNSYSNDGDISGNHGENDYWIVKLTSTGDIDWQQSLGGSYDDWANSIQQTTDGSYIIAGESQSNNGDVSVNHGGEDYWIVKIYGD